MGSSDAQRFFDGAPFSAVASPESAKGWAARASTLESLKRLAASLARRPESTIDLLWANLGAGKSHALLYLQQVLLSGSQFAVSYGELDDQGKGFLSFYRRFVPSLVLPMTLTEPSQHDVTASDVTRVFRTLAHGNSMAVTIARDWLNAGKPSMKDVREALGLTWRIDDDARAIAVLTTIVRQHQQNGRRVIFLVDEAQRLGMLRCSAREALLTGLRSVFSANAVGLSIVLAATSLVQSTVLDFLTPEIKTLLSGRSLIELPELDDAEAHEFMRGRLALFRPTDYIGSDTAPFGDECLEAIIAGIHNNANLRMIPRHLLQLLGVVYDELDYQQLASASKRLVEECMRRQGLGIDSGL